MKAWTALAIALMVLIALLLQFHVNGAKPGLEPWGTRLWDLLRYFTILTNILVGLVMLRSFLGRPVSAAWQGTAALNISMVGLIFQALLAGPDPVAGLGWWPDALFHAVVPLATLLWWLAFAPKTTRFAQIPIWLIWPVAYCVYILIRAQFDGNFVYFFLDIPRFGPGIIARNILGLVLVFAAFGGLMVAAGRLMRR